MSKYFNINNFDSKIDEVVCFIKDFPPINEKEFEAYTYLFYGVRLHIQSLDIYGWANDKCAYKVKEEEERYSKNPLYECWEKRFSQYDGLKILLNVTFGELSCGGVAISHYGQTNIPENRREILGRWWGNGIEDEVKFYIREAAKRQRLKEIFGKCPFRLKK